MPPFNLSSELVRWSLRLQQPQMILDSALTDQWYLTVCEGQPSTLRSSELHDDMRRNSPWSTTLSETCLA
jgi:hypothetical protein